MPHSKSYSVTTKVNLPQPHVEYLSPKQPSRTAWSAWILFVLVGVSAITLIVCLNMLGGRYLFPQAVDPTAGLVPIVQEGELEMLPHFEGSNNGIESRYVTNLTNNNLPAIVDFFTELFESYPKAHGTVYTNCWLENPKPEKPCFFDSSWVTDLCTNESSYGYEEKEEHFNPCFVMKLEKTGNWTPRLTKPIPDHHEDYGFVPIQCLLQGPKGTNSSVDMSVFPSKGFSHQFFPASQFDSKLYLPPLVAVKLHGIRKGDSVTVICYVITSNAFILKNNGKVVITFTS